MAELLLKVGPGAHYTDGDILCAFSRRRIRCCHAEMICHVTEAGFTSEGLRPANTLAQDYREAVYQYRFERISRTEVRRVDLVTLGAVVFSNTPQVIDGVRQHMDVEQYVRRRTLHARHGLFGTPGAEIWYGGRQDKSDARLDLVWAAIAAKTPLHEADHQRWPMGALDERHHLPVRTDDFDDATADTLVAPEVDDTDPENVVTLQKRLRRVDIENVLGLTARQIQDVRDRAVVYDDRERAQHLLATVVEEKTRLRGGGR